MAGLIGIWDLERLLDCAETELTAAGLVVPSLIVASAGTSVPVDDCCEGLLYARVIQQHVSKTNWPLYSGPDPNGCGNQYGAQIGLGIWRCVTGLAALEQGHAPTAAEQSADAEIALQDAKALAAAICCADGIPDNWQPIGADGGCVGGEWVLWMGGTREPEDSV